MWFTKTRKQKIEEAEIRLAGLKGRKEQLENVLKQLTKISGSYINELATLGQNIAMWEAKLTHLRADT